MNRLPLLLILLLFIACQQQPSFQWQWNLTGRSYADPLIEGSTVYVVSQAGEVIAGNYKDGTKKWRQKMNSPIVSTPTISGNSLIVATQSGDVYALNKITGAEVWKRPLGETVEAPLNSHQQMIFIPTASGNLYCLSQTEGKTVWVHRGSLKFNTRPVLQNSYIFIGGWDGNLLSLKMDGSLNWSFKTSGRITEDAVGFKNIVYTATHDASIYALEAPTGRRLWSYKASYPSNLVHLNDRLLFGDLKGSLYSLHPLTGKLIGKAQFDRKPIERIYDCDGQGMIVTGKILRFDPTKEMSEIIFSGQPGVFKLACTKDMLIVTDKLYGVRGYSRNGH